MQAYIPIQPQHTINNKCQNSEWGSLSADAYNNAKKIYAYNNIGTNQNAPNKFSDILKTNG